MRLPRPIAGFLVALCLAATAHAADSSQARNSAIPPLLPKQFAGWQAAGNVQKSGDPTAADPVNASLLKEYGFTDCENAAYVRDDGRKLSLKAARFADASGAYGAFTYYKMPQMLIEKIGDRAASLNERVLFYRGNIVVDAAFEKLTAMSAADLRELANILPLPSGNSGKLPPLTDYLPRQSYVNNSVKYVMGPIGLQKVSAPLSAQFVDFDAGAEVVLGNYETSGGEATLMLINYPTNQIAAEHLRRIDAAHAPNKTQDAAAPAIMDIGPLFTRRTGPIVVVASGPISQSEAKSLLSSVNYDADVTWNENTFFTKRDNIGNLVWNALLLCGILMGFALVIGVAFGGVRIVVSRLFPHRIFDRPDQAEFISLHLEENPPEPANSGVSGSIKAI